jgi:hypothetical protein
MVGHERRIRRYSERRASGRRTLHFVLTPSFRDYPKKYAHTNPNPSKRPLVLEMRKPTDQLPTESRDVMETIENEDRTFIDVIDCVERRDGICSGFRKCLGGFNP